MEESLFQQFVKTFVPLFIVIDAVGNLPFVIGLSEGMSRPERNRMILVAAVTAAALGLVFLFLGKGVLDVMDIDLGAFAIAGGLILLVLSIRYVISGQMTECIREEMVAVVPIGTPLTVGPATITTLLLLVNEGYHLYIVLVSFGLNILIAWAVFMASGWFVKFLGQGGIRALAKVFSLLLAAIAVTMIIHGLDTLNILPDGA